LPAVTSLPPALRLPAVQQLIPALRRMTGEEREELRSAAQEVAQADDHIDVFECCLALLLETTLRDDLERNEEHGWRTLPQVAESARTLFAILASKGSADSESARRAYEAGIETALGEAGAYAPVSDWPRALRDSLHELAALRPLAKKSLVEGLVRTVAHDRRLAVPEGELLRTVCAVLHCPLPPILAVSRT
jgi:hypothetical protein